MNTLFLRQKVFVTLRIITIVHIRDTFIHSFIMVIIITEEIRDSRKRYLDTFLLLFKNTIFRHHIIMSRGCQTAKTV